MESRLLLCAATRVLLCLYEEGERREEKRVRKEVVFRLTFPTDLQRVALFSVNFSAVAWLEMMVGPWMMSKDTLMILWVIFCYKWSQVINMKYRFTFQRLWTTWTYVWISLNRFEHFYATFWSLLVIWKDFGQYFIRFLNSFE